MRLRLLSWNVHKCTGGLDRRYDPSRTARVIAASGADVALLQEVAEDGSWYGDERQVDVIGDQLLWPHRSYFVNVRFGPRRGAYGNAILSRHPIVAATNHDLTQPGRKARSVLHAEVRIAMPNGATRTLHLFNLHLGLGERERRRQLVQFLGGEPFARLRRRTPIVVAGDFNDVPPDSAADRGGCVRSPRTRRCARSTDSTCAAASTSTRCTPCATRAPRPRRITCRCSPS
jgi:endonuclease/exonuclease/phosphatase family metal-dependent hydrolase